MGQIGKIGVIFRPHRNHRHIYAVIAFRYVERLFHLFFGRSILLSPQKIVGGVYKHPHAMVIFAVCLFQRRFHHVHGRIILLRLRTGHRFPARGTNDLQFVRFQIKFIAAKGAFAIVLFFFTHRSLRYVRRDPAGSPTGTGGNQTFPLLSLYHKEADLARGLK